MARGKARELAFQALFQSEQGKLPLEEVWLDKRRELTLKNNITQNNQDDLNYQDNQEVYNPPVTAETLNFAEDQLFTFHKHREEIDNHLQKTIKGWSFNQMAQTDLNILRLALSELLFEAGIPKEVTIEMAIRLAKRYGGEESGRFVNGVLSKFPS